jgi:norsolorinic acid ketoreductase
VKRLVSGANRGIGFGLVSTLLQRPEVKVYAGARDPSKATALSKLASKSNGKLAVVKLSSTSVEDAQAVAETIRKTDGRLDVVIANAGESCHFLAANEHTG